MNEELKPCPFCGSKNIKMIKDNVIIVECQECFARTDVYTNEAEIEATKAWNGRAAR